MTFIWQIDAKLTCFYLVTNNKSQFHPNLTPSSLPSFSESASDFSLKTKKYSLRDIKLKNPNNKKKTVFECICSLIRSLTIESSK